MTTKPITILAIMDGWGLAPPGPGNAISQAKTPHIQELMALYPHTQLGASGESVGLPRGEVGNTETGHLNIGAGRIVYQDLARINISIADGSFYELSALKAALEHVTKHKSKLHLMGLIGAGGVHSNIDHLYALLHFAATQKIPDVYIHAFTDGRDSPPNASRSYIEQLEEVMKREGVGKIASVMGRYWSMDRDLRWDRTAKAYLALTKGEGHLVKTVQEAIEDAYSRGQTDEFIEPSLISDTKGKPVALIESNDVAIFFNFRIDRPRQLSRAFVFPDVVSSDKEWGFDPYAIDYEKKHVTKEHSPRIGFERGELLKDFLLVTMTEYEKPLIEAGVLALFPPEKVTMPLGRVISENGLRQLRAAESEKERFVTYYFNGQVEVPFTGEERLVVPSPKVPTYDREPEMSALKLVDAVIERLSSDPSIRLCVVNFANVDMVGHTGNLQAAVKAVEVVDSCIGKLSDYVLSREGALLITADHGNAEEMVNLQTSEVSTEHSGNPVPFIIVSSEFRGKSHTLPAGILADVAPTVLHCVGLTPPTSMMGRDLLKNIS